MKELIEELRQTRDEGEAEYRTAYNLAIAIANQHLEKEKEQIQKAFSDGQETPINHPTLPHYSRDEYYNDNYNQNK